MFDVSMESRWVKTIRIHVPDKKILCCLITNQVAKFSSNQLYLVELAKSADCDFSCNRLAFSKKSINHKQGSNQENDIKLR